MIIEYYGHSCFRILSKNGTSLVTDPYTGVGYELPSGLQAEIVTVSHHHFDHDNVAAIKGVRTVVEGVKTFEYFDITLRGIDSYHDECGGNKRGKNTVFVITVDGLNVCHLGDIGEEITPSLADKIGKVDVLLLPVGGTYTIDANQALAYVDKIQPKIAIPMHFRPEDGRIDVEGLEAFLRLYKNEWQNVDKGEIEITSFDLQKLKQGKTELVCLKRRKFV